MGKASLVLDGERVSGAANIDATKLAGEAFFAPAVLKVAHVHIDVHAVLGEARFLVL